MTGLDKMINRILDEANSSASQILEDARASAETIMSEAREAANSLQKDWENKSDADVQNYKERVASSVDLKRRTSILEAKQEIISSIVEKAYTAFTQKSGEEYFQ